MNTFPENYYKFFEEFNRGEYYDCHDLLEEIWITDRNNKFLQGLLQLAVAIYHFENGNIAGAKALFNSAYQYLYRYLPSYWDLELQPVLKYIEAGLAVLPKEKRIPLNEVKKIDFPRITLTLNSN